MTSSHYFFARCAQAFGYFRKAQRMGDAASETHLLREAEAQLGAAIWENTENIEALSVEYWNLRKLVKERDEIRLKLVAYEEELHQAHVDRANLLNSTPVDSQELLDERAALLTELEKLSHKRDQIVNEAREVRRSYIGLRMKLEVLTSESNSASDKQKDIAALQERLSQLKSRFDELKKARTKIGEEIEAGDLKSDFVDKKLQEKRQERRVLASKAFQVIGDGNKKISILRAESGLIDTRMRQLYAEIGRYVSRNAWHDAACAAASSSHHGLVDVMRALRRSIAMNHRLAGTA